MRFLFPALLFALFLAAPSLGQENAPRKGVVAFTGRLIGDDTSMRLLVDFDATVAAEVRYMTEPDRIIINLPRTAFNFAENDTPEPQGFISSFQSGTISKTSSRIVLGLSKPALVFNNEVKTLDENKGKRLILDMEPVSAEKYRELAARQREYSGASGDVASKGDRIRKPLPQPGKHVVVLDPGHGGIDGGATGRKGTSEKDITLLAANLIRKELEKTGNIHVEMTREEDVFVSLKERLDFTRRSQADLFISIHADSLSQRSVRGATVYTLSKKASDSLSERLAESENLSDLVAGLALETPDTAVTDILVELTARETIRFSRLFSGILAETLAENIRMINNPQRFAAFGVLKAPEVPGILLELGYLSNLEDEKLMGSEEWRKNLAELVTKAVQRFFGLRG